MSSSAFLPERKAQDDKGRGAAIAPGVSPTVPFNHNPQAMTTCFLAAIVLLASVAGSHGGLPLAGFANTLFVAGVHIFLIRIAANGDTMKTSIRNSINLPFRLFSGLASLFY